MKTIFLIVLSLLYFSCRGQQQKQNKMDKYSRMYDNAAQFYDLNKNMLYYEAIFKRYGYKTPDTTLFRQKVWEYCGIDISKATGNDIPFCIDGTDPTPIILDKRFILLFGETNEGEPSLADMASGKDGTLSAMATIDINKIIFYDDEQAISDLITLSTQIDDADEYITWLVLYLKYEKNERLMDKTIHYLSNISDSDSVTLSNLLFYPFASKPEKQRFRREMVRKFYSYYKDDKIHFILGHFLLYTSSDTVDGVPNDLHFRTVPNDLNGYPFTQDEKDYYKCLLLEEGLATFGAGGGAIGLARSACHDDTAFSQRIAKKNYYALPLLFALSQRTSLVYTQELLDEGEPARIYVDFPTIPDNAFHGIINDTDGYVNVRADRNITSKIITTITNKEEFLFWEDPNSDWWKVMTSNLTYGYVHKSRIVKVD